MRHRIGYSDVLWAIEEAEGRRVNFPDIRGEMMMVRVQAAAVFEAHDIGGMQ